MARTLPVPDPNPGGSMGENIAPILGVRLEELYSHQPGTEPTSEQLHDLRISARRLRYCLEFFRSAFGEDLDETITRIKELQEILGTIHDLDVMEQTIAEVAEKEAPAVILLLEEMDRRRMDLMQQFREHWTRLSNPKFRKWLLDRIKRVAVSASSR